MTASIRGHQARFEVYENGQRKVFDTITRVSINQDSDFSRAEYVGNAIPEGDQSIRGWSGQIEMEVKGPEQDEFMDALINNNLNGIGVSQYFFIVTEFYPDGRTASWVYSDVQWKISRDQSGLSEKVVKRLDWQASARAKL